MQQSFLSGVAASGLAGASGGGDLWQNPPRSLMPKVPTSNVVPGPQPATPPSPTMMAMAAALMHNEGRLFTQPKPALQPKPNGNSNQQRGK